MTAPVRVLVAPINIAAPSVDQAETGLLSLAVDGTAAARAGGQGNPERWEGGYAYRPALPGNIVRNASQITGTTGVSIGFNGRVDTVETIPWTLEVRDSISTIQRGAEDMEARARNILEEYTSYLLERELWLGEIRDADDLPNRVLAGPDTVDVAPGARPAPQTAVGLLVGAMNRAGFPTVMIHAAKDVALRLPDGWRNQQTLEDYGFVVVGGAGYPGTGPTGQAGPNWIYATSMVNYRLAPIEVNFRNTDAGMDRSSNTLNFRALRVGATDFAGPVYTCQVAA
jgi:hypothetical protein